MNTPSVTAAHTMAYADSKSHYEILDGLRGIAAVMVVIFHLFEPLSGGDHAKQIINHGYLAVDFFFALSGFVIGYAYDDRWGKMSLGGFFKRRLIRLHPMIIMGMIIGAIGFYFAASPTVFPSISQTPVAKMLLVLLIGFTLLPVPTALDIRGWGEMHPLNGPAWSLFFEYIGNLLYALLFRRFPKIVLALFVLTAGAALVHLAVTSANGDVIGGWSIEPSQFRIGITRLCYPFFAGLLLSRLIKPAQIKHAFLWCSVLLIAVLSVPRVGDATQLWVNGLYDAGTILLVFPLIVYLGASGELKPGMITTSCRLLGNLSYPLYIIHYPLIYIYTAWVADHSITLSTAWPVMIGVLLASITIAYACLKWYDIPVRKWLTKKFIPPERKS